MKGYRVIKIGLTNLKMFTWRHQTMALIPFRFNILKFTGILQTMYSLQTQFRDFAGSDYHNRVSNTYSFGFSVHKSYAYTIVSPTKRAIVCLRKQYAYLNLKILYC